jgi:hypothetical protein
MRPILLALGALLLGTLLVTYGALLALRPDRFLRFHDTFIDRSKWNRSAEWRKHVADVEYKVLGIAFVISGLFIVFSMLVKLL